MSERNTIGGIDLIELLIRKATISFFKKNLILFIRIEIKQKWDFQTLGDHNSQYILLKCNHKSVIAFLLGQHSVLT